MVCEAPEKVALCSARAEAQVHVAWCSSGQEGTAEIAHITLCLVDLMQADKWRLLHDVEDILRTLGSASC